MSGIKIKIGLPFFGKKEKKQIETIEFSDIENYM